MNNIQKILIIIGIIFSTIICGCIESSTPTEPVIQLQPQNTTHQPPSKALTYVYSPTPTSQPYISISYSHTVSEYVSMKEYPASSGQIYLIATINIENHGYDNFNLDHNRWFAFIDNVEYRHSYVSHYLDNKFNTRYIKNNGKLSGGMAFEIPKNGINASDYNYRIGYNNLDNYNIKWNKK